MAENGEVTLGRETGSYKEGKLTANERGKTVLARAAAANRASEDLDEFGQPQETA